MSVQIFCIKCDRSCRIPPEYVGKRVRCPGCQEVFKAEPPPLADDASPESIQVFCPKCDKSGRVAPQLLGRRVRCAQCQESFIAEDVPVAALDEEMSAGDSATGRIADDSVKTASDPTLKVALPSKIPLPPPLPEQRAKPVAAEQRFDDRKRRLPDEDDEEEERDSRSSRDRDDRDRRDDYESDRRRSANRRDDDVDDDRRDELRDKKKSRGDDKSKSKKDAPLLEVGRLDNPFVDSSTLGSVEVDHSVFEFDYGDEPPPDRDREQTSEKRKSGDSKRQRSSDSDHRSDKSDRKGRGSDDRSGADARHDHAKKDSAAKKPASADDDAAFLGLANMDEPPAATENEPVEDKKAAERPCFHLRQADYWDEPRLFRVFVDKDELIFIAAAIGDDIPDMEDALSSDSLEDFDKRIRKRVRDLDELSIDELLEGAEASFVWSAGKIVDASVDPAGGKSSERRAALLRIDHKTKGKIDFDLPLDRDVKIAVDLLRDPLAKVLHVNVRWDKASRRFIKR